MITFLLLAAWWPLTRRGRRMTGSAFKAMDVLYTLLLAEKLDKGRGPGRGGHGVGLERRAGGFLI